MIVDGINITELCLKNYSEHTDKEFDLFLLGYCDKATSTVSKRSPAPSSIGYVVFYSCLVFISIALNLLVMVTIFSRNRLRTIPNTFMVSLSVADTLMAAVAIPLRIIERSYKNSNIIITSMLYPCIGVASILSLCCVTLDRYMHIKHPLDYDKYMNKVRAVGIVAVVWVFSIFQALVFLFVRKNRYYEAIYNDLRLVLCFGIPAFFIIITYIKLFIIARSHARVIATTSITISDGSNSQKKDFKILKIIALIVGTFILCWFPFLFAVSYELHAEEKSSQEFYLFMGIAECLEFSTCVLNPIIYGLLRRDLRISMRYVAACKRESIEESESL